MSQGGGVTSDIIARMTDTATTLSKGRKKRPLPPGLASPEAIAGYSLLETLPIHKSATPGIPAASLIPSPATARALAVPPAA